MKININYQFKSGPWGGGNQFLKALKKYFQKNNRYVELPDAADVILVNSHHFAEKIPLRKLRKIKNKTKLIVVHRVDGPMSLTRQDRRLDKVIFSFNRLAADATIFQSKWNQNELHAQGMVPNDFETVIINAPDPDIFYSPKKKKALGPKIRLITTNWSPNPRKGFDIYKFLDENLNFDKYEMTFVGNCPVRLRKIKNIDPQPSNKLANLLRRHDLFVIASMNDPCSNSLIEALHCGLPAVVRNSGGHLEIIGRAGVTFGGKDDVLQAVDKVSQNLSKYKQAIDLPNIKTVGDSYYDFCKKIYDLTQKGDYQPKKLNFFDYFCLKLKS